MIDSEADDLMLKLMQVADIPEPESTQKVEHSPHNPLAKLKPYPYHAGCGGPVLAESGTNEDDEVVVKFTCAKCGFADYVDAKVVIENGLQGLDVSPPEWVRPPDVR